MASTLTRENHADCVKILRAKPGKTSIPCGFPKKTQLASSLLKLRLKANRGNYVVHSDNQFVQQKSMFTRQRSRDQTKPSSCTKSQTSMKTSSHLAVCGGYLTAGILFLSLAAHAGPLQPEVLFRFAGEGCFPQCSLVQGTNGNFYGTVQSAGSGPVFQVTTDGALTWYQPTNGDFPYAGLTLGSDGNLYGVTHQSESYFYGSVFRMTADGSFTTLLLFDNTNGAYPAASLTLGNDGCLYGTTESGGSSGYGTVFRVTTDGTLTTLASFDNTNGAYPDSALTLGSDGNFYGTTTSGGNLSLTNLNGASGCGTIFRITSDGALTTLASFAYSNSIVSGLTQGNDGNFYGTTEYDDDNNFGAVFKVTPNGTLTTLLSFAGTNGAYPDAALVLGKDGGLYGTTYGGGIHDDGTVFQVTTNGTLTTLVSLAWTNGANPAAALTLGRDGSIYGTTFYGGIDGYGSVFRATTNGTLTTLVSFSADPNGAAPIAVLTQGSDGDFYGTTARGPDSGSGTVFKITTNGIFNTLTTAISEAYDQAPGPGVVLGNDGNFYGTSEYNLGSLGGGAGSIFQMATNGTVTTLASFDYTNGRNPYAGLTLGNDGNFYGTTASGGSHNVGTVFKITTNGTLTSLVSFAGTNGANPYGGLTLGNDGNFYGTTHGGGKFNIGTVFRVLTNGALTTLVSFSYTNGANPFAGLTLGNDGNLYGTTDAGGSFGGNVISIFGTVFRVSTNGALTTLVSFAGTNGANPWASLTLGSDGNFYGTTFGGEGQRNDGTVFQVTTNGTLTMLVSFDGTNGAMPAAALTLGRDGDFYGTTASGRDGGEIYRLRHGAYIQSFGRTTNGFALNVLDVGGSGMVVLESSPDLKVWTPIQTNGTAAAQQFFDASVPTHSQQFYRVVQQ